MADYVMLEDIFETTENMTVLRDNRLNDDGTDTVTGVDWFRFRETTAASFYVSGNSWIGIGQNSEPEGCRSVYAEKGRGYSV